MTKQKKSTRGAALVYVAIQRPIQNIPTCPSTTLEYNIKTKGLSPWTDLLQMGHLQYSNQDLEVVSAWHANPYSIAAYDIDATLPSAVSTELV